MRQFKSCLLSFLVAVCATASAVLVRRFILVPIFDQSAPLITFTLAVVAATWISGIRGGLLATLLGTLANTYLDVGATGFHVYPLTFELRLLLFGVIGTLISWLVHSLQSARRRMEDRQKQLEAEIAERRKAETSERQQREQLAAEMCRREAAELALREREERVRLAVESAEIGTWDFNPLTGEREWSNRAKAMFGLPPDADVRNRSFRDLLHPEDRQRASRAIYKALDPDGDGAYEIDYRAVWSDGSIRWIVAKGQVLFKGAQPHRRATRFIGTVLDITDRKHAETALRRAEEKFRAVATHAPVGIFETDSQGRCRFVNDAWCDITGATLEDALGDGWQRFLHPDDRQQVIDEWQDATLHRQNHTMEFRFLNKENGIRSVIASATAMLDSADLVSGYVGTIVDVTQRKAAEDAVRASEARLREREERIRLAVESTNIGTFDFNPVTGERDWSDRTKVMWGLSPDADVTNVSFLERLHPEDRERAGRAVQKALDPNGDGAYDIDCRVIWPDGTVHWFIAKGQALFEGEKPNRRASRFIGTVFEITERKQAEAALRQAEARFRTLATHAPVGIFQSDAQGRRLFLNDTWCAIAGASQEDALGDGWQQFVHPDDRKRIVGEWQDAILHRRNHVTEFRFLNPQTGVRWVIASATAMLDSTGEVSGYVGTVVDMTERKAAEDVIRASESRLQGILDNTSAVIYLKDWQGRYLMINRRYEELFNVTQQEIVGKTNAHVFPGDVVAKLQANDRQVRDTGQPLEFEEVVPHDDGPHTYVTVKFPIKDASGAVVAVGGISTDISDRKRAADALEAEQEMLRHTIEVQDQERQLVTFEIHDGMVQHATGALMRLEGLRDQVKSEEILEEIDQILGVLRRTVAEGRRIVNGIRTPVLDDCGVVAAVEQLIDDEERAHVKVEFIKDEGLGRMAPNVEGALYHITQEALTNIYKHSKSRNVRVELGRREDRVHLEIRDWGVGFTPPVAFKGVHGLKGMTERARIAGGRCNVESALGEGTRIVVDLPYVAKM
jgi:PAS domain S-box-containing protein